MFWLMIIGASYCLHLELLAVDGRAEAAEAGIYEELLGVSVAD